MSKNTYFIWYLFLLFGIVIFSYLFIDRNLIYYQILYTGISDLYKFQTTVVYILLIVCLYLTYFYVLRLSLQNKISKQQVFILICVTIFILFLSYPAALSYDVFNYILTSKVLFLYRENPYIVFPTEFINEPYLQFTRAANKIALYGPGWILLTGIPYILSFGTFIGFLLSVKALIVGFYIFTLALIWKITRNIYSIVFFGLNPLVVFETLISSHNDIVMMFFALSSFYLIQKRKFIPALILFLFSVSIKYVTILLLPIFIFVILMQLKRKKINWDRIYIFSAVCMIIGFLFSPIREEFYAWYAVWFLTFITLTPGRKKIIFLSQALCFGLMMRYVPYMISGTYIGLTPFFKEVVTFLPVFGALLYILVQKYIWPKKSSH